MPALRPLARPEFGLFDHGERAARERAHAFDHRVRVVGRTVVDEHDFVRVVGHGLIEQRFEHAFEQRARL